MSLFRSHPLNVSHRTYPCRAHNVRNRTRHDNISTVAAMSEHTKPRPSLSTLLSRGWLSGERKKEEKIKKASGSKKEHANNSQVS